MKRLSLFLIPACLFLCACTGGNSLGYDQMPEKDALITDTATFSLKSKTVIADSILQRNPRAVLGEYTDAHFGTTQADFMAQLYCPPAFKFPEVVDNEIDSVFLYLFYNEWFGSEISLFETSVYLVDKQSIDLEKPYFTNIKIEDYCSRNHKLGSATFTPLSAENKWTEIDDYCVRIPLDKAFAQKMLEDSRIDSTILDGPVNFAKYFDGLYVTVSYGNGCMVYITDAQLEFCYNIKYKGKDDVLRDTVSASYFPMTKEVRQINRYSHPDLTAYLAEMENDSLEFIYAPAGLFTEVELPLDELTHRLSKKNINYARLKISATGIDDDKWALSPPEKLLLLKAQDIHTFFGDFNKSDNINSFMAAYDEDEKCYIFDMSSYIQQSIRYADGDLDSAKVFAPYRKMLVLPVEEVVNSDEVSLYLLQDTRPSAMKLRSADNKELPMKLELVYSSKNSMTM